jgi:hypothetical protein
MRIAAGSSIGFRAPLLAGLVALAVARAGSAQTTKMPSTLRHGSGYLDVPMASVLPHLAVTGTFSGFRLDVEPTSITPAQSSWFFDGSAALGLFDRVEIGATLQSLGDAAEGGSMWGGFGRVAILRPEDQGIGIAGGVQWVSAPDFGDPARNHQPPRLGFPDARFFEENSGVQTELTLYGVTSVFLRGLPTPLLPDYDVTISVGYGNGMFLEGQRLDFYHHAASQGWFVGGAGHLALSRSSLLHIMGEWNGFDVNLGAQLDLGGLRLGGHVLGANYWTDVGAFRSPKLGFLASVCLDPSGAGPRCRPELMARAFPDTIRLPAPPPDTVIITREVQVPAPPPPIPTGTPTTICLATGEAVEVLVSAQGDTLVGPARVSVRSLRPAIAFAGTYAGGREWYLADQPVSFEQRDYDRSGSELRLECSSIERVGEHMGVALFAPSGALRPLETLYVPVRPGVWQAYRAGLQRTRGEEWLRR